MNRFIIVIIISLATLFSLRCKKNPISQINDGHPIKAIGTYQFEHVDKNEWGDFQLVLLLNNSTYSFGESIYIKLYFCNIGNTTITLDGIMPASNLVTPPLVSIWQDQRKKFEIFEVNKNLLNNEAKDKKIVILPSQYITLMKFNLIRIGGFMLLEDTTGVGYIAHELINVYSEFHKGTYKIAARFGPMPPIYYAVTDTITFSIN